VSFRNKNRHGFGGRMGVTEPQTVEWLREQKPPVGTMPQLGKRQCSRCHVRKPIAGGRGGNTRNAFVCGDCATKKAQ
jgi:hypothetical protein